MCGAPYAALTTAKSANSLYETPFALRTILISSTLLVEAGSQLGDPGELDGAADFFFGTT
jgi:hypothetical protein